MRTPLFLLIFFAFLILLDLYVFKGLREITPSHSKPLYRQIAYWTFWIVNIAWYIYIFYAINSYKQSAESSGYQIFFMAFGLLILFLIPKLIFAIFHLFDDISFLGKTLVHNFSSNNNSEGNGISRWDFITKIGLILAAIPFASILYGILKGRYDFQINREKMKFAHLPASLNGLKIVHISDIHIGSFFNNYEAVKKGVDMVNAQNPDLIFFTGDLVNNYAHEVEGWQDVLKQLKARHGIYSILGNHDYGDYAQWTSASEKAANLERLKNHHKEIGFTLLLNEHFKFSVNGSESIEIIGVENWGTGGFSQYGDLQKAMQGGNSEVFQILLSHDPSHWDAQVLKSTKIDLTLSGHTHGMQFGIEIPGIKWSPAKYRYPRWGGLYKEGVQSLYVNRGFGYIGFPGRIGMPPEITVIELLKA